MRIDVHAHYWTEDYLDPLVKDLAKTDAGVARGIGAGGGDELGSRLRLMDRGLGSLLHATSWWIMAGRNFGSQHDLN